MDEFCRIEKAIFSIDVKVYDQRLERDEESLYYLSGAESDVFQCPNYNLSNSPKLKILILKDFKSLMEQNAILNIGLIMTFLERFYLRATRI